MKKKLKLFTIAFIVIMLIPFMVVNAETKTEKIVEDLKETAKSFDGTVKYEDDIIEIEWNAQNSKSTEIRFSYNDNIIEYNPGEITTYKEAEDATNHYVYAMYLIEAALRVNGYSEEEIQNFFKDDTNEFNYEKNGFELKEIGKEKSFTSEDGSMTTTVTPFIIKIDITKANLNKGNDTTVTPKSTTIENIVEFLQEDSDFIRTEQDGKVISENDIYNDDETITIYHVYYWEDYHNVLLPCENDILTYEDEEMKNYEDAERALSHQLFAYQILMSALKLNGYTTNQIQEFFADEKNELNYDKNGIELKETGDSKSFTSEDGSSTVTASPMIIKIDFAKANLEKEKKYVIENEGYTAMFTFNEGHNFTLNMTDLLTIDPANSETLFNVDSETFTNTLNTMKNNAKEYGEVLSIFNIMIQDGNLDYTNAVSLKLKLTEAMKKYNTLKLLYLDDANNFKVSDIKYLTINSTTGNVDLEHLSVYALVGSNTETTNNTTNNPQTGDNIMFYISLFGLSILSLFGLGLYIRKEYLIKK